MKYLLPANILLLPLTLLLLVILLIAGPANATNTPKPKNDVNINDGVNMEKSCMSCKRRTHDNKCAVKIVFAENFAIQGGKYKKSVNIIQGSANNCTYYEEANNLDGGV